jgi:hypothetical protein
MRFFEGFCAAAIVVTAGSTGLCQDFGRPGQFVLSAERLTGVYSDHITTTQSDTATDLAGNPITIEQEESVDTTQVSVLGMSSGISEAGLLGPATIPRFGFDVFVIQGLSLGGSVMVLYGTGTTSTTYSPDPYDEGDESDQPSRTTYLVAPRVGYAFPVGPAFAIWPRGGVTYTNYRMARDADQVDGSTVEVTSSIDFTDVSLEVMVVASPVPNFAILFGPYVDIPLGGGTKYTVDGEEDPDRPEVDLSYLSYGVTAGIGGYF